MAGRNLVRKPADLLRYWLLHLDDRSHWPRWLEAAGVPGAEVAQGRC
jgi:LysR family transcriptional regulator, glycine cleavage system transcriptional activator